MPDTHDLLRTSCEDVGNKSGVSRRGFSRRFYYAENGPVDRINLYRDGWSEETLSERVVMRVKRPDERLPVDVLDADLARLGHRTPHVVDMVVGQRHRQPGHYPAQQAADVVMVHVLGRVHHVRDRTFGGHVRRRMGT